MSAKALGLTKISPMVKMVKSGAYVSGNRRVLESQYSYGCVYETPK
jgi:hypothetical protein